VADPDRSPSRLDALDVSTRRRLVARAVIVSVLIVAGLVATFYLIPWEGTSEGRIGARIFIVVVSLVAVTTLSIQSVIRSQYPVLTVFQALAAVVGFALVAFASVYLLMSLDEAQAFSEPLSRTDALYFALTTATTIGYGDITAKTEVARVVVMFQMVINVVVIGVATRALLHTARKRIDLT
jgi:voltage-gated potassium channel